MTAEDPRRAVLSFLQEQPVGLAVRAMDIAKVLDIRYSTVYATCNRLRREGLVERVGANQLSRTMELTDGRTVVVPVESGAVGWRAVAPPVTAETLSALEATWEAPAVEPDREPAETPVDMVGKATRLMARLRSCAAIVGSPTVAYELERIALGLGDLRDDLIALIVDGGPEPAGPSPDYGRNARAREKNPEPGKRRCSKCHLVKPLKEFTVTDSRTGKRRADCRTCYNESQRTRYVRAGYKIVTVEVMEGDFCVGHPCPVCEQPFEVGQLVQGENVMHAACRDEEA